jgi:hypothetical protein
MEHGLEAIFPGSHGHVPVDGLRVAAPIYNRFSEELTNRSILATFSTLVWSGANSIFARDKAAADLARKLDEHDLVSPGCTQLIVGHSHGGKCCGPRTRTALNKA